MGLGLWGLDFGAWTMGLGLWGSVLEMPIVDPAAGVPFGWYRYVIHNHREQPMSIESEKAAEVLRTVWQGTPGAVAVNLLHAPQVRFTRVPRVEHYG